MKKTQILQKSVLDDSTGFNRLTPTAKSRGETHLLCPREESKEDEEEISISRAFFVSWMGSNRVNVTNFLKVLMTVELYLEI